MGNLTYLVVGASSGIGRQLAIQLSESENHVYATYNKNRIEDDNNLLDYYHCNVLDENMDLDFLPDHLDGLAYCPGSINLKPFQRINPENFISDFQLQVVGAIKVIQKVLQKLKSAGNASIVLISTVAVQQGMNFHTQIATSKGAIEGLTKSLAAEFAPGIRVNCIAPSLTDTPLAARLLSNKEQKENNAQRHPLKRIGTVNDIANAAEFLLSANSGWITGQIVHVDGGMSSIKLL